MLGEVASSFGTCCFFTLSGIIGSSLCCCVEKLPPRLLFAKRGNLQTGTYIPQIHVPDVPLLHVPEPIPCPCI